MTPRRALRALGWRRPSCMLHAALVEMALLLPRCHAMPAGVPVRQERPGTAHLPAPSVKVPVDRSLLRRAPQSRYVLMQYCSTTACHSAWDVP